MSVKFSDQEESLGIFELDNDGTVIYSSFEESNSWVGAEKDIKGRDFFNEVLAFTNVAELQRRLEAFKAEEIPARSFDFVCHFHQQSVPGVRSQNSEDSIKFILASNLCLLPSGS